MLVSNRPLCLSDSASATLPLPLSLSNSASATMSLPLCLCHYASANLPFPLCPTHSAYLNLPLHLYLSPLPFPPCLSHSCLSHSAIPALHMPFCLSILPPTVLHLLLSFPLYLYPSCFLFRSLFFPLSLLFLPLSLPLTFLFLPLSLCLSLSPSLLFLLSPSRPFLSPLSKRGEVKLWKCDLTRLPLPPSLETVSSLPTGYTGL